MAQAMSILSPGDPPRNPSLVGRIGLLCRGLLTCAYRCLEEPWERCRIELIFLTNHRSVRR
jgi:hypothetical protein